MARHEQDREDLLAEAVALTSRVELEIPDDTELIVVGFRDNRAASVYFSPEIVYHLTSIGQLRRAFFQAKLYKAEKGTLVAMTRRRDELATNLLRRELSPAETQSFLAEAAGHFDKLQKALTSGNIRPHRQVPADEDVVSIVAQWLNKLSHPLAIADHPRVC